MARKIKIDTEEPEQMVVLKCIANSYFNKAGESEKRRRKLSLEKEIECLSRTNKETSIVLIEVMRNYKGFTWIVTDFANGKDLFNLIFVDRKEPL